jgi:chromate reductase, NAD(P)H dehydrogenase (quinone)
MPAAPVVVAFAGSLRLPSFNRKLLALATRELTALGAQVDVVDLKTLALPVYDGDVEAEAPPPAAAELKQRIARADAMLISTPEYNQSIPGGLKNAIDWASRQPNVPFKNKVAAIMGATQGNFGTVHSQAHLRHVLMQLGVWVMPSSVKLSRAQEAFTGEGELIDAKKQAEIASLMKQLLHFATLRPGALA